MLILEQIWHAAFQANASDIHLESQLNGAVVHLRTQGVLKEHCYIPKEIKKAIFSTLKRAANLDCTNPHKAQDGMFAIPWENKMAQVRIASTPTAFGESLALRILRPLPETQKWENLPIELALREHWESLLRKKCGLFLITGATGSGKTTSMHALANWIGTQGNTVITIEDPVEYILPGAIQVAVEAHRGRTFAHCLKASLRHDPDVIIIGEIRDFETAQTAVQAALTGHLVLSTLHANSPKAAKERLETMIKEKAAIDIALLDIMHQKRDPFGVIRIEGQVFDKNNGSSGPVGP